MSISSFLAFENALNSAISFATRSLVPGIHRKNTTATPAAGTKPLDYGPEKHDIFCNDRVVELNTPLALELHYHSSYVKEKQRKTQLKSQDTSRFIKATRAFPEDWESEFPLLHKRSIPVSLPPTGMDVELNKEAGGVNQTRAELHYPEICDYGYPLFENNEGEETSFVFHSLPPRALPLIPDFAASFVPFSQETLASIRSQLAHRTRNAQNWFFSERARGYRARKSTSLAPAGLRWKEMQIAQCASTCSQRLLGRMGTGWKRLEVEDDDERLGTPAFLTSINGRNGQVDGALEPWNIHKREDSGTTEELSASSKLGGYEGLANHATGPQLRDGKLQMNSMGDHRVDTSPQKLQGQSISGNHQTPVTSPLIPLTGPPRRRRPPINIDWATPKWNTRDTAALTSHYVNSELDEKRLSEDLPPLTPQVSPKTVPSSPTDTLNPSSTHWQRTLQVDFNVHMGAATYESPRPPPISPPPRRSSLEQSRRPRLTKSPKNSASRGNSNPKIRSRQAPRRTSSLDFACRGSIARMSVFSEDIDPGFKRTQSDTATTWSPGNTIRMTRRVLGRALASAGLIGWREREQKGKEEGRAWKEEGRAWKEEGRAWKEGPIRCKPGATRKVIHPEYYYPTPPLSPHPGNRIYIAGSSSAGASVAMNVRGAREVQAVQAAEDGVEIEAKLKRKKIMGFMKLMGK